MDLSANRYSSLHKNDSDKYWVVGDDLDLKREHGVTIPKSKFSSKQAAEAAINKAISTLKMEISSTKRELNDMDRDDKDYENVKEYLEGLKADLTTIGRWNVGG